MASASRPVAGGGSAGIRSLKITWETLTLPVIPDPVPPGWIAVAEYAQICKINKSNAGKRLKRFFDVGLVERRNFKLVVNGRRMPIMHYRIKQNA